VFGADHSFSIDQCGHVDTISTHVAILTPFYYFPLALLCVVTAMKITMKIKKLYSTRLVLLYNYTVPYTHTMHCRVKGKYHAMASVTEGSDTAVANLIPTSYYIEFNKDSNDVNLVKHTYK